MSYIWKLYPIFEILYTFDNIVSNLDHNKSNICRILVKRGKMLSICLYSVYSNKKVLVLLALTYEKLGPPDIFIFCHYLCTSFSFWMIDISFAYQSWYKALLHSQLKLVFKCLALPNDFTHQRKEWREKQPMPRRNFREIDTNSSGRRFGTGDRFTVEVNRSSCLGVRRVDLLPAERPALDQQCPSPVKGHVLFPVNTNGVGLLNGPEWMFCTSMWFGKWFVFWSLKRFANLEEEFNQMKGGGQKREKEAKIFGKWKP